MPIQKRTEADEKILALKSDGLSFREISKHLGKSLGSVTGRYYRLKGVRHPSQIARDAKIKKKRELRRAARRKERSLAAIQAAIELRKRFRILGCGRKGACSRRVTGDDRRLLRCIQASTSQTVATTRSA
jgi:hypothetical protein